MLLSRVADSLYWIGRHLERAENVNRHILVAGDFAVELEGIMEEIAVQEWSSLVASLPAHRDSSFDASVLEAGTDTVLDYLVSFLVDKDNPYSVVSSLGRARENARAVAESITIEVTTNLNESHRRLSAVRPGTIKDSGMAQDVARRTHNSLLTTLGAIEHTLTRDESWNYMKFGEAMERTQRTILVFRTRLPKLLQWDENMEDPLYFASWRSVLRSLASLENYRHENGPKFQTEHILRFILFHPAAPRSVFCGVRRMSIYMSGMSDSGPAIKDARRRLGRLAAKLEFEQDDILKGDVLAFLDFTLNELYLVHEAVTNPLRRR